MKRLAILLSAAVLGGCVSNPEKECGLYDFDCDDVPEGEPLFVPAPVAAQATAGLEPVATPTAAAPAATPAPAAPRSDGVGGAADLKTRIQMLEEEVRRLRRRVETLEAAR